MIQETKVCIKCKIEKKVVEFALIKRTKKRNSSCKECTNSYSLARSKTKRGLVTGIYCKQKSNSKKRKMNLPSYNLDDLYDWVLKQDNFNDLYDKWVRSNYNNKLTPSIDRLDDYKSYTFDNIQLVTWKENKTKSHEDMKSGINTKTSKAIIQFSLDGDLIKEFPSIISVERELGISRANIKRHIKNKTSHCSNYLWKYKNEWVAEKVGGEG